MTVQMYIECEVKILRKKKFAI